MPFNSENKNNAIFDMTKRLLGLYVENVRLTTAEKLTILFSSVALFTIAIVFAMIGLIFVAIGLASMLEDYIAPFWSYFIIAAVLFIIAAILFICKTQLIFNPIAKFISKLLLDDPNVNN